MSKQYVTFLIGAEEYGLEVTAIREIRGWVPATPLPDSPPHLRGVIDLRGHIVPILDLRARFGGGLTEVTPRHVVVVVAMAERVMGILVDAVADIITAEAGAIQPVPDMETRSEAGYLAGLLALDGHMVALLDLGHVVAGRDAAAEAA